VATSAGALPAFPPAARLAARPPPSGHRLPAQLCNAQAPGRDGQLKSFEKPWASTLLMFIGMACCLPAAAAAGHLRAWLKRLEAAGGGLGSREPLLARHSGGGESAASNSDEAASASSVDNGGLGEAEAASGGTSGGAAAAGGPSRRDLLLILIPTAFDLLATVTMAVGLLYVTASVYQMMRGSEIGKCNGGGAPFCNQPRHPCACCMPDTTTTFMHH
jgi:hypothetical protein